MKRLIIHSISHLYTPSDSSVHHGEKMNQLTVLNDAYIVIDDESIKADGEKLYQVYVNSNTMLYDAPNACAIPGIIDSHTHLVHGGSREHEFALKLANVPYLDILNQGGGILSTVEATRKASFDELYDKAFHTLDEMLKLGVTTLEAKSGYGLNEETEIKQLKVVDALSHHHPIELSSTYMGAHAIPKEYRNRRDDYIEFLLNQIETIHSMNLAEAVDVFCETDVFSTTETERILSKAQSLGLHIRMHADEIHSLRGAKLAVNLNAISADHLMAIDEEDIETLGRSNTIANLLPQTSFYLNKPYANARKMLENNVAIAISSDYNPGSAPSENMQFAMQLASNQMKMTPYEVLNAITINASHILNRQTRVGSLEVGKQADIVLLKVPNLDYFFYHFGINHTQDVFKKGRLVVKDQSIIKEVL